MNEARHERWSQGADAIIGSEALFDILGAACDVAILISREGRVQKIIAQPNHPVRDAEMRWLSADFGSTLTRESVPKFDAAMREFLADAQGRAEVEVNHDLDDAFGVPVRYRFRRLGEDSILLLGRDWRDVAITQQHLIEAQVAAERLNAAHRHAETRLDALMKLLPAPVVIFDRTTREIDRMNASALQFFGVPSDADMMTIDSLLDVDASPIRLVDGGREELQSRSIKFRLGGRHLCAMLLSLDDDREAGADLQMNRAAFFESSVHGHAVIDSSGVIQAANPCLASLLCVDGTPDLVGASIGDFLQRGGVDQMLLLSAIGREAVLMDYPSGIAPAVGPVIPVNLTAFPLGDAPFPSAVVFRPSMPSASPRTEEALESLSSMVGRTPLKEIIHEAVLDIERICINAALAKTGDNRAAAADILGLSRQSLYVKLRKLGLETKG